MRKFLASGLAGGVVGVVVAVLLAGTSNPDGAKGPPWAILTWVLPAYLGLGIITAIVIRGVAHLTAERLAAIPVVAIGLSGASGVAIATGLSLLSFGSADDMPVVAVTACAAALAGFGAAVAAHADVRSRTEPPQ